MTGSGGGGTTRRPIVLNVNDRDHEVWVLPSDTLLDVLHDGLGMADVRYGCGEGVCGTCTVLLDGEPVNGCLTLAVQAAGHQVTTLRGLMGPGEAAEALHPLQECFLRRGAAQCGFCTPGMVLTALDLVRRRGQPKREEIRYALVGNLCRCTGYTKILDAIEEYAGQAAREEDGGQAAREGDGGRAAREEDRGQAAREGDGGQAAREEDGGQAARDRDGDRAARGGDGDRAARGGDGDQAARGGEPGHAARGGPSGAGS